MRKFKNLNRAQVKKLASGLAKKYSGKDVVIGLVGELGAGKTTFTKDFGSFLGIKKIKSPTFIIGSTYPLKNQTLYHYDFYRLSDSKQLRPLGFEEIFKSKNRIVLIEWVDKFPKIAQVCDLIINLKPSGKNLRHVTLETRNSK
ncbi:MAG: tRNA (adenosine(37)-N6)-threonylcarbamoyltransferase complex ATPase subunit type 1 TsaE [Candidatus Doudnabacteria bacterium]|nr:tRNA (adenosine(37)-N6)-threonylcarbamoyltransferase complex ATPase subunit type 1 TsaE [Candidatus Doudnabacteria bacterium]